MTSPIELIPIPNLPSVRPGDDLAGLLIEASGTASIDFRARDVLVVAQKIVSKAEDRLVDLRAIVPSAQALELAARTNKDPRLVQVVLSESREVLRAAPNALIVEHRLGFVCANAGVDQSNADGADSEDWALLLPFDPDASAQRLRAAVEQRYGVPVAVIVNDSHGRTWRFGSVGVAIGVAGLRPVSDLRGRPDRSGRLLQITEVGTADEIAAAASLAMGQAAEGTPAVIVRGANYMAGEARLADMLRPKAMDLFR